MQILSLTIVLVSLILLGTIVGIYLQSKVNEMHTHIQAVYNEMRVQLAILSTKITELEKRGTNDTEIKAKELQEWDEITDPNYRWDK